MEVDVIKPSMHSAKFDLKMTEEGNKIKLQLKWTSKKKKPNSWKESMLRAIIDHFLNKYFNNIIHGYTDIKKDCEIYRADTNYCHKGPWNNNILISWAKTNKAKDDKSVDEEIDYFYVPA